MGDQASRAAARHAPGSLEELAWGLRTGTLRPRDPSFARHWAPSASQRWRAERVLDLLENVRHLAPGWRDVLVVEAWLPPGSRWSCTLSVTEPSSVAWCEPSRPARHGILLARAAERLVAWSHRVVRAPGPRPGRVTIAGLPTPELLSDAPP